MGVDYSQYCIIGIKVLIDDLKVLTSPAVYEEQNRYDPKTGKLIGTEQVLLKEEESHYEWEEKKYQDYWELSGIEYDGSVTPLLVNDDYIYFGYLVDTDQNYGKVNLVENELTLEFIQEKFDQIRKRFPDYPVQMHFVASVG